MRLLRISAALVLPVAFSCIAQSSSDLLDQAFSHYTLLDTGTRPWHLVAAIQLYNAKGAPSESGTVEQYFVDPEHYRVDYKFADLQRTEFIEGNKRYVVGTGALPPGAVQQLIHYLVSPVPLHRKFKGAEVSASNRKFGAVTLDCFSIEGAMQQPMTPSPAGLFPEFCTSGPEHHLRLSMPAAGNSAVFNQIGTFQGSDVPMSVSLKSYEGKMLGELKVTELKTFNPSANPDLLKVPENVSAGYANATRVSGGVMAGRIISKTTPSYPRSARADLVQGPVIIGVRIGTDGTIQEMQIMSAPRADLAASALVAVRQWTYKPYMVDGVPTDVDSTITVNFNIQ